MVEKVKIGSIQNNYNVNSNIEAKTQNEANDVSLFNGEEFYSVEVLKNQLNDAKANNGVIADGWDDFKNFSGLGLSSDDCDKAIEDYKAGKISFEQAEAKINEYKNKQESSLNLLSNIATGITAIVAGTAVAASGGIAAIGMGALAGAATKAGSKTIDRATNKVEGDALDAKQIAKDALSGAVTGGIGVATAGTGGIYNSADGFKLFGKTLYKTQACVAKSAVTGVATGSVAGASNNLIECAFEEDKEFNFKDFAKETATSAVVGGTVGAIMGGFNGTLRANNLLKSGGKVTKATSTEDIIANSVCNAEYKLANKLVRSVAA